MTRPDAEVVVIGAGPYGLSAASYLRAKKRSVVVVGELMATWRDHMPAGMFLKSTPRASAIASPARSHSFLAYRSAIGEPPVDDRYPIPIAEFISYGEWFASELVPIVNERVKSLEQEMGRFVLTLASGERLSAKVAVLASGVVDFAYLPDGLARLGSPCRNLWHSSEFNDLESLAGSEIAVIGAGQSALEAAVLAREAGAKVHLLVRKPGVLFGDPPGHDPFKPPSLLGPGWSLLSMERLPAAVRRLPASQRAHLVRAVLGPSGAWWLRPRFTGIDVRLGVSARAAAPRGDGIEIELSDGDTLTVSHVIAATGYRPDPRRISYLSDDLRSAVGGTGSHPARLGADFESRVRGLFLTGLGAAPTFGPLLRFVAGSEFTSRRVERGVSAALARSV